MKIIKSIFLIALIIFCNACTKESFEEEFPTVTVALGNGDYFLSGTYDGQPFELDHTSLSSFNHPIFGDFSFYGSKFILKGTDNGFTTLFKIAISTPSNDTPVLDAIKVGQFSFEDVPIMPTQEPFKWHLPLTNGFIKINGINHSRSFDSDFDKIEIENVVEINTPSDFTVPEDSEVFQVTGNFQVMLLTNDSIPVEFIIDDFSLLFDGR